LWVKIWRKSTFKLEVFAFFWKVFRLFRLNQKDQQKSLKAKKGTESTFGSRFVILAAALGPSPSL
jgi:hypothetical protein